MGNETESGAAMRALAATAIDGNYAPLARAAAVAGNADMFGEAIAMLSPATRLELVQELYRPVIDEDGNRAEPGEGVISTEQFEALMRLLDKP